MLSCPIVYVFYYFLPLCTSLEKTLEYYKPLLCYYSRTREEESLSQSKYKPIWIVFEVTRRPNERK